MPDCCIFASYNPRSREEQAHHGPMITFIVTTYNLDDWLLCRCIDSIVAQGLSRDQYEVIVVDDESAVSPQHVVDRYASHVDISLYVQRHARQGAARNVGLCHAKGKWVQFVDGDDYLFPGTMSLVLKAVQSSNLDLLMFGYREVRGECIEEIPLGTEMSLSAITTGDEYMTCHNLFGVCWRQLFRRQLLDDPTFGAPLRFSEGIYIEDEEFVTKLMWRAQHMACTDVPVYAYYQREGSTVHARSREHADELFRNYFVVLSRLLEFDASLASTPHVGYTRKLHFLALDILRRALREPDWRARWADSSEQLRALGMYPLPARPYSFKYRMFRLLAGCRVGRFMLRMIEKRSCP